VSPDAFQYALVRVVPRIDRGEFINVGVIVFSRTLGFLAARIELDERRLAALAPELDAAELRPYLDAIVRVADGEPEAGPIARLSPSERFHWMVAPSSTVIQTSPVHTGLCEEPERLLEHLMATLVRAPGEAN
jgi:Protein of unknown function (DUF3037)